MRQAYTSFDGQKAVVVVSFDDGWATDYTTAWPLFKARGIAGTSYIVSDIVDSNNPARLDWTMVSEMAQGSSFSSWTVSINSNPSVGGSTNPSGIVNVVSGSLTATATPAKGYLFSYWLFDGGILTANPLTLPPHSGEVTHSLTAYFVPTASATIFQDGFESGSFSANWWTEGSTTIVSSPVHGGAYAAKATGASSDWTKDLGQGYSNLFFAGFIQMPALPANGQEITFFHIYDSSWNNWVYGGCGVDSSGSYWLLRVPGGHVYKTHSAIPVNQWIFVELERDMSGTANLWVNDVLKVTITGQTFTNAATIVQGGNPASGAPPDFISYGDDYTVATGYISSQ